MRSSSACSTSTGCPTCSGSARFASARPFPRSCSSALELERAAIERLNGGIATCHRVGRPRIARAPRPHPRGRGGARRLARDPVGARTPSRRSALPGAADPKLTGEVVLGERAILEPLFDALQPATALICWIDQEPRRPAALPGAHAPATVTSCTPDELEAALGRGARARRRLVARPPELAHGAGAHEHHRRRVSARRRRARLSWSRRSPGRGAARTGGEHEGRHSARARRSRRASSISTACCSGARPEEASGPGCRYATAARLQPWLDRCRATLEASRVEHLRNIELDARNFALFELLDQSQRDADRRRPVAAFPPRNENGAACRRTLLRKEAVFRPSGRDPGAPAAVDSGGRGSRPRPEPAHETPRPGALRVTYVLPELRLSGGALVVMQLVNELRLLGVDAGVVALGVGVTGGERCSAGGCRSTRRCSRTSKR